MLIFKTAFWEKQKKTKKTASLLVRSTSDPPDPDPNPDPGPSPDPGPGQVLILILILVPILVLMQMNSDDSDSDLNWFRPDLCVCVCVFPYLTVSNPQSLMFPESAHPQQTDPGRDLRTSRTGGGALPDLKVTQADLQLLESAM